MFSETAGNEKQSKRPQKIMPTERESRRHAKGARITMRRNFRRHKILFPNILILDIRLPFIFNIDLEVVFRYFGCIEHTGIADDAIPFWR